MSKITYELSLDKKNANLCAVCRGSSKDCENAIRKTVVKETGNVIQCDSFISAITPRASGNTTRFVDKCIQELFNTGRCSYKDLNYEHYVVSKDNATKIKARLELEHPHIKVLDDTVRLTLTIIK